jgi:hypothetical protein
VQYILDSQKGAMEGWIPLGIRITLFQRLRFPA